MPVYAAPLADMRFVIEEVAPFSELQALPGYEDITPDLVDAILNEAGKLASEVLAPLNPVGDREGAKLENGVVRTPPGTSEAYRRFVEGGWGSLPFPTELDGQGLPTVVANAVFEMWTAANMAFALCPMLTQAAAEALALYGTEALRATYLPKLISGEWTGTMNLTEPNAGSDLAQVRTKAVPDDDAYRIFGQKIFITYGDHDLTENIVHMVLARLPDAPSGIKGLSLFLVPKQLVGADGRCGAANDVRCVSLEHKLGINASPTALMAYGDAGGAVGYLLGEPNHGLNVMFTMMNAARLAVGLEGVGIADRAYQRARAYALSRVQGRLLGGDDPSPVTIAHHPDVQRMLMAMKAKTEAARALAYFTAAATDGAHRHPDPAVRHDKGLRVDLLTPVVKAWCTDVGIQVADLGIQIHGGMGYIEESGAPQHLRDARIAAIYEGTNGIQANDLVTRKVMRDHGETMRRLIAEMRETDAALAHVTDPTLAAIRVRLGQALDDLAESTQWLLDTFAADPRRVAAGAVDYLNMTGIVVGGWLMAKAAIAAARVRTDGGGDPDFLAAKLNTARFFADSVLVETGSLKAKVMGGAQALASLDPERHL